MPRGRRFQPRVIYYNEAVSRFGNPYYEAHFKDEKGFIRSKRFFVKDPIMKTLIRRRACAEMYLRGYGIEDFIIKD